MYLTATSVCYYLMERGLLSGEDVVAGDVSVAELDRHNRGFVVLRERDRSLYVKQIKFFDQTNVDCLRREAACCGAAQSNSDFTKLAELMPRLVHYDPRRHAVIVEYLAEAENLHQCKQRLGGFPVDIAALVGRSLALQHSETGRRFAASVDEAVFPRRPPWILSFHEQDEDQYDGANRQLLLMLRADQDCRQMLEELRSDWRRDNLVHGDYKWNNVLVCMEQDGGIGIRVIDWELADCGDSCWDAGTMLQCFLSYWVLGTPLDRPLAFDELIELAGDALESLRPAIREFWAAYISHLGLAAAAASDWLQRSVHFAGARMMQTTYEYSRDEPVLDDRALTLLNLGWHILEQPHSAIEFLLGPLPC